MPVCDKWVALKIIEFLLCVSCLVAKRVSQDDEARLALLLQKLSREWSLLTSVTWDSVGGAFADAVYGGYVIITFGLILARVFQEVPRGRRILEGFFLGFGMLFFLVLGGLELASLDSVPRNLVVNASVLGTLSLAVAALFLIDLMGPRIYTATHQSQTDGLNSPKLDKKVSIVTQTGNGNNNQKDELTEKKNGLINAEKQSKEIKKNGQLPLERPKKLDIEKVNEKTQKGSDVVDSPFHGYTNFDEVLEPDLEASKFGSLRNGMEGGNYVRLSDPFAETDFKMHYEQELAKFNEKYLRNYLEMIEPGRLPVKENYLPELQTPVFAKVKSGRLKSLYDDMSPSYGEKMSPTFENRRSSRSPTRVRTVPTPTLQQLEDYLRSPSRGRRSETPLFPIEEKEIPDVDGRASGTPTDPGFVQYTAKKWPDKREIRTPRHSPT